MLGTYASTLIVLGSAALAGQAVLVASGQRRASPLAPLVGLGPILALGWGAIRLPGEAVTALIAVLVVAAACAIYVAGRVEGAREAAREALPAALVTLLAASIPFVVEGRFGVLGTGFNVDMSQHLFAASWLADPTGPEPGLVGQGYPLGPHALAAAVAELTGGNLVHGFDGLTVAIAVIAATGAIAILRELQAGRRVLAATLVALPYLFASYLAQGQFKELLEALFLLGFAICLHESFRSRAPLRVRAPAGLRHDAEASGPLACVPLAAISIGALYSYSAPGLVWLGAAAVVWGLAELYRRRDQGIGAVVRSAAVPAAVGVAILLVVAAPELGRVADFRSNATNVAGVANRDRSGGGGGGEGAHGDGGRKRDAHDNDLGNLFGQVTPSEMFGIWPSGDFRVKPGGGGVPAPAFWLGILLGAGAFAFALARWLRRRETAVPAALLAAVAIYLAALALATPYTSAKALLMVAPLVMMVSARGALAPDVLRASRSGVRGMATAVAAAAFVVAATGSSLLVLGKAPVGPAEYSRGLAEIRPTFQGRPTLVLADPAALEGEHAREFLDWEARGGDPVCIEPTPSIPGGDPPDGIRYVVTTEGEAEPPFAELVRVQLDEPYGLWERRGGLAGPPPEGAAGAPSECGLGHGG